MTMTVAVGLKKAASPNPTTPSSQVFPDVKRRTGRSQILNDDGTCYLKSLLESNPTEKPARLLRGLSAKHPTSYVPLSDLLANLTQFSCLMPASFVEKV